MALATDLVSVDQVASELNWSADQQTKYATEIAPFISATTKVVERIVGAVVNRDIDEWLSGGSTMLKLSNAPVSSVTSVTEFNGATAVALTEEPLDGDTIDVYGFTVDNDHGVLVRRITSIEAPWASGLYNVHVVYTAGRCADTASVPAEIERAALEIIRVNWQPQQGGNRPAPADQGPGKFVLDYFVSAKALQLLGADDLVTGFA